MANYAKRVPTDEAGSALHTYPSPFIALTSNALSTGVSSLFTLNPNTTVLEVTSPTNGIALKWVGVAAAQTSVLLAQGSANFDHIVPSGTVRRFVIPKETQGVPQTVALNNQVGSVNGLYQRAALIPINGVISSIFTSEF